MPVVNGVSRHGEDYPDTRISELDNTTVARVNHTQTQKKIEEGYDILEGEPLAQDQAAANQPSGREHAYNHSVSTRFSHGVIRNTNLNCARGRRTCRPAPEKKIQDKDKSHAGPVRHSSPQALIPVVPQIPLEWQPRERLSKNTNIKQTPGGPKPNRGPKYEVVEGAKLDARPASCCESHNAKEVIPEFEASDIRTLPDCKGSPNTRIIVGEDVSSTSSSRSRSPGHETDASEALSRSSNSSPPGSGRTSNPLYEHVDSESWSYDDGHLKDDLSPLSDILSMIDTSPTNEATQAQSVRTGSVISKPVDFAVIQEEDGESVFGSPGLAAAPPPTVKGIKHADRPGGTSETIFEEDKIREESASHHEDGPPAVLSTSGIGGNSHTYQTKSASLPQSSSSSSCPVMVDTKTDTEVASSIGSAKMGPLGHLHSGLSKAAHAMREKVKKNVSFSLVDNVRLRTPSPTRSSNGPAGYRIPA